MTVVMRKGDKFADIFDSQETISQARKEGYHHCTEKELVLRKAVAAAAANTSDKTGGRLDELMALKKPELIEIAKTGGFFEDGFDKLKKEELANKIMEHEALAKPGAEA